jgi:hypothetical protein
MGTLATPAQFVAKLGTGENSIPENQFTALENKDKYATDLFTAVLNHRKRDNLVQNFPCLAPAVRTAVEERIRSKGASSRKALVKLVVWTALTIAGIAGIVATEGGLRFLCVVGTLIAAIVSIVSAVKLRRAIWCRDILKSK